MEILRRLFVRRGVRMIAGVFLVLAATGALSAPVVLAADAAKSLGFDTIANIIGGIFMYAASGIGSLISNFIEVIVAVIQYNNFSTSPVVSAGWAIIRDTVNMFYVVLLIVIAFGTIIGSDRFKWAQDIPKLLRWAIIINFSKTLCGLMIDASQVVTLTFANAIKDIAGGNFVTFLGLNSILSLSTQTPDMFSGNPGGYAPYDYMFGGIMAFVMMLIVLVVLVALLAILVFRIVMLWILITVSPLAWFAGSQTVLSDATGAYKKWWGDFKCYLAVGPVLVFFLWLALAVAGSGNIAAVEGFNVTDTNNSGLINQIFDMPRLTSFILGLALIMAGFQQAASVCSGAQSGSVIKGILGKAEGLTKSIARKPADLGLAGGKAFGNRIPLVGNKSALGPGRNQVGAGASRIAAAATGALGLGAASKYFSDKKGEFEKADKEVVAETAARRDAMAGSYTDDGKKKAMEGVFESAKKGDKVGVLGRDRSLAVAELKKAVEDKDARKKMGAANFDAMMNTYGKDLEKTYGKDDKFKDKLKDFKKGRADLFTPKGADGKTDWKAALKDTDAMRSFDFSAVADMKKEEKDALAAHLKGFNTGEFDAAGNELTAYQLLEQKKLGKGANADVFAEKPPQDLAELVNASYTSGASGQFATADDEKRVAEAMRANIGQAMEKIVSGADVAAQRQSAQKFASQAGAPSAMAKAWAQGIEGGGKGKGGKGGSSLNALFDDSKRDDPATRAKARKQINTNILAISQITPGADGKVDAAARKFLEQAQRFGHDAGDLGPDTPPIGELIERFQTRSRNGARGNNAQAGAAGGASAPTVVAAPAAAAPSGAPAAPAAAAEPAEPSPITVATVSQPRGERPAPEPAAPRTRLQEERDRSRAASEASYAQAASTMNDEAVAQMIQQEEAELARQRTLIQAAERANDAAAVRRAEDIFDQVSRRVAGYRQAQNSRRTPPTGGTTT